MSKMKIFLITPKAHMGDTYYLPLGLYYIKSYIEKNNKNVDVFLYDLNIISESQLMKNVKQVSPDIVGITCFSPNRFLSLDIAKQVKGISLRTLVVLGGFHASFLHSQILRNFSFVDMIIRGEGEKTFSELIDTFQKHKSSEEIKGLVFRRDGDIVVNEKRKLIDNLDSLPFPHYREHFINFHGRRMRVATIITSRGCSGGCRFCAAPTYWGKPRFRSPENVIDEISTLVNKYKVEFIYFMDDTFTDNPERTQNICNLIKKKGFNIKWRATARVNTLNSELLKIMREAGCVEIVIGIESGSQKILNRLGKKTSVEKIREVCKNIKELKLNLAACFIVGSPGENRETIEETKKLMKYIKPDAFSISQSLYLFPGTVFSREFSKTGIYNDNMWLDRNISSIKYLAEHKESVLTSWQIELIKTGWKLLPLRNKLRYIHGILKWINISQIHNVVFSFLVGRILKLKNAFQYSR